MSEKLGVSVNTLRQRITRLGIKPITQEALYTYETLNILKNIKIGRPKKEATNTKVKEKSTKKGKK